MSPISVKTLISVMATIQMPGQRRPGHLPAQQLRHTARSWCGAASSPTRRCCSSPGTTILRGTPPQYQRFTCSACVPGTYFTSLAFTACDRCGGGKFSAAEGADTLSTRQAGSPPPSARVSTSSSSAPPARPAASPPRRAPRRARRAGTRRAFRRSRARSTAAGARSPGTCQPCAGGTYVRVAVNGSGACAPCRTGVFSTGAGARSSATCEPCCAGTYAGSDSESASAGSACAPCHVLRRVRQGQVPGGARAVVGSRKHAVQGGVVLDRGRDAHA
jgi:hypothetical protein